MLIISTVFSVSFSVVFGQAVGEWRAPGPNDIRGPCPGFNTMANYGYLNRDGRNIKREDVVLVFKQKFNMAPATSNFLLDQALNGKLFNPDGTITLNNLGIHGPIEHDVSLVRNDWNPASGQAANSSDHQVVQENLVSTFYASTTHYRRRSDAALTLEQIGAFRAERYATCKALKANLGQKLDFGPKQALIAFLEASLLPSIFGNPDYHHIMEKEAVMNFLSKEILPADYQPPKKEISIQSALPLAATIAAYSFKAGAENVIENAKGAIDSALRKLLDDFISYLNHL